MYYDIYSTVQESSTIYTTTTTTTTTNLTYQQYQLSHGHNVHDNQMTTQSQLTSEFKSLKCSQGMPPHTGGVEADVARGGVEGVSGMSRA